MEIYYNFGYNDVIIVYNDVDSVYNEIVIVYNDIIVVYKRYIEIDFMVFIVFNEIIVWFWFYRYNIYINIMNVFEGVYIWV